MLYCLSPVFTQGHTFKGIVKAQLPRFFRICTKTEDFWEAAKILFRALKTRGYSRPFLRQCLSSFKTPKLVHQKQIVPLITQYSTISKSLNYRLKKNFNEILGPSGLLQNHEVISAYKKNNNLKDLRVRAKLTSLQDAHRTMENFCSLRYVKNLMNKRLFKLTQNFMPQTTNVVYLGFCIKCDKQYVRETQNSMRTRMWQHKYNIINKKETNTLFVRHFISHGFQA